MVNGSYLFQHSERTLLSALANARVDDAVKHRDEGQDHNSVEKVEESGGHLGSAFRRIDRPEQIHLASLHDEVVAHLAIPVGEAANQAVRQHKQHRTKLFT